MVLSPFQNTPISRKNTVESRLYGLWLVCFQIPHYNDNAGLAKSNPVPFYHQSLLFAMANTKRGTRK